MHEELVLYCERMGPGLLAEPFGASSNLAFFVAAWVGWRAATRAAARTGARDVPVLLLVLVTLAVGIGSTLFHTLATRWAMAADVVPIAVFIHGYFALALARFLRWPVWAALIGTAVFAGFALWLSGALAPWFGGTAGYLGAAAALFGVGIAAWAARPAPAGPRLGMSLVATGAVFVVSLAARMADLPLCHTVPIGTHFLWHVLNGVVLGRLLVLAAEEGRAPATAPG